MSSLSFINNMAKAIEAVGLRNTPIAYGLAMVPWESPEDRDAVLAKLGEASG
jgi:hypothetical protein